MGGVAIITRGMVSPGSGGGSVYVPRGGGSMRARFGGSSPTTSTTWAPVYVGNPLLLHLTTDYLAENLFSPLVAGDDLTWRFQVRDEFDAVVDLTGATMSFHVYEDDAHTTTLVSVAGVVDSDQSAETGATGKGWFGVPFTAAMLSTLTAAAGRKFYQCSITFGNGSQRTFLAGRVDILRRH